MTNQQGAPEVPEAPKVRSADYEAGWKDGYKHGAWASAMAAEPVAWMTFTEEGDPDMVFLDRSEACQYCEDDDPPKPLYTAPQPSTAPATQQPEGGVVAYLDVGVGGYLDLGSELSEDALQQLPKGRHALVIAGTYGIDGYVTAPQPSPTAQSVLEDAARYRCLRRWKGQEHEPPFTVQHEIDGTLWGGDLDAAIDSVRKQGANHASADATQRK